MKNEIRGADVVIVGLLVWLIWKDYNPEPLLGACSPLNVATNDEPISTLYGPAWTRNPAAEEENV